MLTVLVLVCLQGHHCDADHARASQAFAGSAASAGVRILASVNVLDILQPLPEGARLHRAHG